MTNYDFKILHSNEFEWFTRDLLQASEGLRIESFADGRDGGIDLRFAFNTKKTCIVQCKRYMNWKELLSTLKKEVPKVRKLNPQRYILSTSVDLTAANKKEIKDLFTPYIKDTAKDILGKSDLNNLLGIHPDIEKRYYKLWLGSSSVLDLIVHKNIINWSEFEREVILSEIGKYVMNDSFKNAHKIIIENHYVIISGIPGIGKTTLARMLVYYFLAHGFDEFVYVVDDLDKACELYDEHKKQVFFFDDFLGSNSFVPQGISFENKLLSFINRIKKSPHTLFIMTTREYILSAAKCYYEKIGLYNIEMAKCTVDLSNYSKVIRAQILYNHLAEADLPTEYIDALVQGKKYMKLVEHKNYNPRVIEGFINKQIWRDITPDKFMATTLDFFDRPLSVWEKAFSNLDTLSRYALLVFSTLGNNVYYEEWRAAYRYFCEISHRELGLYYDDTLWLNTAKILQDCFVKIEIVSGNKVVNSFNPSIMDFCATYIRDNKATLSILLKSALYPEQLTILFTDSMKRDEAPGWQVEISRDLFPLFDSVQKGVLKKLGSEDYPHFKKRSCTKFYVDLLEKFPLFCRSYKGFIEDNYDFEEFNNAAIHSSTRFDLMRKIDWEHIKIKPSDVLHDIANNEQLDSVEWIDFVETAQALGAFSLLTESSVLHNLDNQLEKEIDNLDNSFSCQELSGIIIELSELLPTWDSDELQNDISEKENRLKEEEVGIDYPDDYDYYMRKSVNDDTIIHEMFTSLYEDR